MKNRLRIFLFLLICTNAVYSQFDAQLSQYMLNSSAFNPAAVGQSGMIDVIGQHRLNWLSFQGGGTTTVFSLSAPLKIETSTHGIGVSFLDDNVGWFTNQSFHLQYAFKKQLGSGLLSLGADLGFVDVSFSGDSLSSYTQNFKDYEYFNFSSDDQIPTSAVSGMAFDMGIGAMYTTPDWYAGVSMQHLNMPTVNWTNSMYFLVYPVLFLTGGMNFSYPDDDKLEIKPSVLFKSDFSSWAFDLSGRVEYDNKYWGGLSYRLLDAVVLMAGMNIASGLSVGYSFDISTNKLITTNYGSHELFLIYSFEYVFNKNTTKYKSIRFL
ncbi:MAG: PorP/SprF family type IX secretion system membrane protein [Paludibacter sp.]|nr:PorP/SprF family type IX secretion system membrane protein [Paludibacter sp.]